jgi:hypothetical protein
MSRTEPAVSSLHRHTQFYYCLPTYFCDFYKTPVSTYRCACRYSSEQQYRHLHRLETLTSHTLRKISGSQGGSMKMPAIWVERYTKEGCHPDTLSIIL